MYCVLFDHIKDVFLSQSVLCAAGSLTASPYIANAQNCAAAEDIHDLHVVQAALRLDHTNTLLLLSMLGAVMFLFFFVFWGENSIAAVTFSVDAVYIGPMTLFCKLTKIPPLKAHEIIIMCNKAEFGTIILPVPT